MESNLDTRGLFRKTAGKRLYVTSNSKSAGNSGIYIEVKVCMARLGPTFALEVKLEIRGVSRVFSAGSQVMGFSGVRNDPKLAAVTSLDGPVKRRPWLSGGFLVRLHN